jgi:hypothetical protein
MGNKRKGRRTLSTSKIGPVNWSITHWGKSSLVGKFHTTYDVDCGIFGILVPIRCPFLFPFPQDSTVSSVQDTDGRGVDAGCLVLCVVLVVSC